LCSRVPNKGGKGVQSILGPGKRGKVTKCVKAAKKPDESIIPTESKGRPGKSKYGTGGGETPKEHEHHQPRAFKERRGGRKEEHGERMGPQTPEHRRGHSIRKRGVKKKVKKNPGKKVFCRHDKKIAQDGGGKA